MEDKIIAFRIKRDKSYTALVSATWEPILSRDSNLPNPFMNPTQDREVLVGMRMLRPLAEEGPVL
jgi:hypothetical protein